MTIKIVDIESCEWQSAPETWEGKVASGEPDVRFKYFATGAAAVPAGQIIEYEAGHVAARHSHEEGEIFYMLSGDLTIGDDVVEPGMLVYIEARAAYGPSTTEHGCRFLRLGLARD